MEADLSILLRLVVATLLAGAIGWERESLGKAAGIRTHMFVAMGAALFVALGDLVIRDFQSYGPQIRFDPIRLIEAIVAAMGFIGAGTILVGREPDRVKGLTTAASLWVTAAVGIAVGLEHYLLAVGTTALAFVVLRGLLLLKSEPERARPPDGAPGAARANPGDAAPHRATRWRRPTIPRRGRRLVRRV